MAAATLDIEFARNEDWARGFIAMNNDDPPVAFDLTGATFDFDVRYIRGTSGNALLDLVVDCPEPETGHFTLELKGSDFDNIGNLNGNSRFVYDVVITQDGRPITLLQGTILLRPGVSNNEA